MTVPGEAQRSYHVPVKAARIIVDPETSIEVWVPDFATDAQAILRARRIQVGEIPALQLAPEYGCVLPLWDEGGPAIQIARERLPRSLRRKLEQWQQDWEFAFVFPDGWASEEARGAWAAAGEDLYTRLEEQLWDVYVIDPTFRRMT